MARGGSIGLRVVVSAAVGCVVVAVIVAVAVTHHGDRRGDAVSSGRGAATTAVSRPTVGPGPTVDTDRTPGDQATADQTEPALAGPEASPRTRTDSTPAPPAVLPTDALPTEVIQALADMATQLDQAGDDGRPQEMTREEVDALVTAQLRALGIEL